MLHFFPTWLEQQHLTVWWGTGCPLGQTPGCGAAVALFGRVNDAVAAMWQIHFPEMRQRMPWKVLVREKETFLAKSWLTLRLELNFS